MAKPSIGSLLYTYKIGNFEARLNAGKILAAGQPLKVAQAVE